MQNATVQLLRPLATATATDALQRDHAEHVVWSGRARLSKMSVSMEATIAGQATVGMWRCRLVLPRDLREIVDGGWRVEATLDGDTAQHEYRVTRVAAAHHVDLTLERVG